MSAQPLRSWVAGADGHPEFPLENLPFGVFSRQDEEPRGGVAIGDCILDLRVACTEGLFSDDVLPAAWLASAAQLNRYFALPAGLRRQLRTALQELLSGDNPRRTVLAAMGERLLPAMSDCRLHLPAHVGDYTDFYVGIHHAESVGRLFRPDAPLLPNYKFVPIGYHGRASTLEVSSVPVRRPNGQQRPDAEQPPILGPSQRLDYELELGIWVGPGNAQGEPIPIESANQHIAGFCLLNDWSARDLQAWEYQPLGPFLSKSFATTLSPWVVTAEALEPFRAAQPARPEGDPDPLPYLANDEDQRHGALDIELEVLILTQAMRNEDLAPVRLALSNTLHMYWTVAQLIAHHTVNGCALNAGDLLGTGTLSGPNPEQCGSLLELCEGGKKPIILPSGERRTFLEDGDEIILRAHCHRTGQVSIGFGECRAVILPAPDSAVRRH